MTIWYDIWDAIVSWAFWVCSLYLAFQLGQFWNERDVADAIAAITERQAKRRSQEFVEIVRPSPLPPSQAGTRLM
jgi:hypothetical protein